MQVGTHRDHLQRRFVAGAQGDELDPLGDLLDRVDPGHVRRECEGIRTPASADVGGHRAFTVKTQQHAPVAAGGVLHVVDELGVHGAQHGVDRHAPAVLSRRCVDAPHEVTAHLTPVVIGAVEHADAVRVAFAHGAVGRAEELDVQRPQEVWQRGQPRSWGTEATLGTSGRMSLSAGAWMCRSVPSCPAGPGSLAARGMRAGAF